MTNSKPIVSLLENNNGLLNNITIDVVDNILGDKISELSTADVFKNEGNLLATVEDINALNSNSTASNSKPSCSRRSSSGSNSSLKQTQNCINLKLRRRRILQQQRQELVSKDNQLKLKNTSGSSRKRKRHKGEHNKLSKKQLRLDVTAPAVVPTIKCIKIAINGGIATRREISFTQNNVSNISSADDEDKEYYGSLDDTIDSNSDEKKQKLLENPDHYFDEADVEEENSEVEDYHEVVTRNISVPSTGNSHIVLTIKKTPSKNNSPSSGLQNSVVESNQSNEQMLVETLPKNSETIKRVDNTDDETAAESVSLSKTNVNNLLKFSSIDPSTGRCLPHQRKRKSRRKKNCSSVNKLYNQLFFAQEICIPLADGSKPCLFNISSCSSSSREESDDEELIFSTNQNQLLLNSSRALSEKEIKSVKEEYAQLPLSLQDHYKWHEIWKENGKIFTEDFSEPQNESEGQKSSMEKENQHAFNENNRMLLSFNNIIYSSALAKHPGDIEEQQQQHLERNQQQHPNENCDDLNNLYNNNNNFNIYKYDISKSSIVQNDNYNRCTQTHNSNRDKANIKEEITTLTNLNESKIGKNQIFEDVYSRNSSINTGRSMFDPHQEYLTGMRAVDEDVDDEDGNNCARIQEFKEWHQVLQLRSYNDELLTVLPYVVLE